MFEKCRNIINSSFKYETNPPFNLLMHVLEHNNIFGAYVFGARISPGLLHCSTEGEGGVNLAYLMG
jgi:hypothetical protein